MAIRNIRIEEEEFLRKKCKRVEEIDEKIITILDDMMDTLHSIDNGAALAANQIGILKRLIVIDYCGYTLKLINPEIIGSSGLQECIEGCLSFPERFVKTIRPQTVTVMARNEKNKEVLITVEGEMAKCFCHEIEHLDGEIFLDKAIEELYNK